MLYLIAYDLSCNRRRRRLARLLEGFGERLHESAFQCQLREGQLGQLRRRAEQLVNPASDRLRIYPLCQRDAPDQRHLLGTAPAPTPSFRCI
jgi:CRISPR-associated protein Cas2